MMPRFHRYEHVIQRDIAMENHGIAPPGFRLPDEAHVGRVRLQVSNLARSQRYYETVVGLTEVSRSEGSVVLGAAGNERPFVELHERAGARPVPRRGLLGLYHFAILLPDRASLGRFAAHLAEMGVYAGMSDHFVSEAIYLSDPDGLGIEVYADRPRSEWKFEQDQLYMTTKPLDVDDLVTAAGGERWSGVPKGTRIGHVHLYVGDIDQAARFYHEGVGLDKIVWTYPGALFLSAGGYHHHLGVNTWAAGAPPAGDDDAKLIDWELALPDEQSVNAAAESIERVGTAVERNDGEARASDPWGTTLRMSCVAPAFNNGLS
ncbi:MAG TPA: VOC family protein [Gemmatimonadaceae bacterium]|nr:VOC family protein [Gemmatimonadaceae bacterium]